MKHYCDVCDKTIKLKSENNHPKSFTHNQCEKFIRINHTIKNTDFFAIDKIFNNCITNHIKLIDFYLDKCGFNLVFKFLTPNMKTHFHHNTTIVHLKRFFLSNFFLKEDIIFLILMKGISNLLAIKDT